MPSGDIKIQVFTEQRIVKCSSENIWCAAYSQETNTDMSSEIIDLARNAS